MREIKFRLWDCDNESFSKINFEDLERVIEELDSFRDYFSSSYFVGEKYLQQFTGLKDKNGKEIYEGDKFKPIHNSLGNLVKCPILVYKDMEWVLKEENSDERPNNFEYLKYFESIDLEIIGNIHENKIQ